MFYTTGKICTELRPSLEIFLHAGQFIVLHLLLQTAEWRDVFGQLINKILRQTGFWFAETLLWVSFPHRLRTLRAYCRYPNQSTLISQCSCKEPHQCLVMFNRCAGADVNNCVYTTGPSCGLRQGPHFDVPGLLQNLASDSSTIKGSCYGWCHYSSEKTVEMNASFPVPLQLLQL